MSFLGEFGNFVDLTSLTLSLAFHFVHSNAKAFSMFFHMLMLRLNEEEVNHGLYERKGQFLPFPINLFRREEKVCESTIRFLTVVFRRFGLFVFSGRFIKNFGISFCYLRLLITG